ncbi:MAG: SPASM domain-containing protein [Chlamydiales bacterium]|nr:SPASM domain-containing protein [Chlamydiales bacterium]
MAIPNFKEVRIENTNSCGYKCVMCPREKLTRSIGFMSMEDFSLVADRISPFFGSIHLHGFGESLLDRKLPEKLRILKTKSSHCTSFIISTLGVKVKEEYLYNLLTAGLDQLMVSMYGFTQESYKNIHGYDGLSIVKRNLQWISDIRKKENLSTDIYIKIPENSISSSLPMAQPEGKLEFIEWADHLGFKINTWNYVHNYGNGRAYNVPPSTKICPVVVGNRREILNVTWDLNIVPCCYDFNASIRFGNLKTQSIEEIFSSTEYFRFLVAQQTMQLSNYPVCQNCEKSDYT